MFHKTDFTFTLYSHFDYSVLYHIFKVLVMTYWIDFRTRCMTTCSGKNIHPGVCVVFVLVPHLGVLWNWMFRSVCLLLQLSLQQKLYKKNFILHVVHWDLHFYTHHCVAKIASVVCSWYSFLWNWWLKDSCLLIPHPLVNIPFCLSTSIDGSLGGFLIFAINIMDSAAVNILIHVFWCMCKRISLRQNVHLCFMCKESMYVWTVFPIPGLLRTNFTLWGWYHPHWNCSRVYI